MNEAIDGAVRELVQVDPPAGMRARVLSRLDAPSRPNRMVPGLAAAVLAAAIVLAFVFTRSPAPVPAPLHTAETVAAPVSGAPSAPVTPVAPAVAPSGDDPREIRRLVTTRRPQARPADRYLPAPGFSSTIAIAPLTPIDPIAVAPLQPSPVAAEDIVIEPLAPIAELEIAPLFPSND